MEALSTNTNELLMAERAFLSTVISDPDSMGEIDSLKIDANDFIEFRNRLVFQHFVKLKNAGISPDYITLAESLNMAGELERVGGQSFLVSIFDEYASSANLKNYAELIKRKSVFRDVVQKAKEIQNIAVSGEVSQDELLGKINKILIDLNDSSTNGNSLDLKDSILQVIKDLRDKDSIHSKLTKTGFESIDDKIVGISPGQLIVLAARPSMGKTALALNIGQKIAENYNEHVVVFSLEMLHSELTQRLISMESLVNSQKFKSREFNAEDLKKIANASEKLSKLPVIIDDYSSTSLARIRTQCLRYKAKHGKLRAVVVDYLQLMTMEETKKGNKADDIGVITRGLKLLAKELECPVILLSQLNRGVEGRDNKRPMLQDLRSSGDIEQDADMVWFIYRDEVYNADTKDRSEAEIIIAKNRGGEIGTAKLAWRGEFTKFAAKAEDVF
jgi:replicative DNA helicase